MPAVHLRLHANHAGLPPKIGQTLRRWTCSRFRKERSLNFLKNGAQGRNRTTDTAIFSRMLYQLSYLGEARAPAEAEA